MRIACLGGGGFIAGHLAASLDERGHEVVCADVKPLDEWCQVHPQIENIDRCDLSVYATAFKMLTSRRFDRVYLLAANMGGIFFIEHEPLNCILSVDISSACLKAARDAGVDRLLYSSSACAYPVVLQTNVDAIALTEDMAGRGRAEKGYGEEKLFTESMCEFFASHSSLSTRVARLHNVYGPKGTFAGGREKAPAAICRKVAEAVKTGVHDIEIWGDGEQTRSFMYVDDCVLGLEKIMESSHQYPLNLGSSELVTVNNLVTIVEDIARIKLQRYYNTSAPQGVRGRNSDNTLIKQTLNWEPSTSLRSGLEMTYEWIAAQL